MAVLFFASLSTILFELALTRIFSIILWYDYAFMAISVAFFGLGIGSLLIHMQKDYTRNHRGKARGVWRRFLLPKFNPATLTRKLIQYSVAYAVSMPLFIFVVTLIPPDTSYIHLYYLASSVPFFFAGSIMALIFLVMPRQISKLYFADLVGASSAALLLDPLMLSLGAESVLLLTSILVAGSSIVGGLLYFRRTGGKKVNDTEIMTRRLKISATSVFGVLIVLLLLSTPAIAAAMQSLAAASGDSIFKVRPGPNKGLYWQLKHPEKFDRVSTQWNSFSRVDVMKQTTFDSTPGTAGDNPIRSSKELASILIDADAGTPIFQWGGSVAELAWMRGYMDYLPYEIADADHALVIGSGGGQDILMSFAGGAEKVTAVEINPMVVSAVRRFGGDAGNVYDRSDVDLYVDDGRRFIGSSTSKYDMITIKLVDSWAAQLAGGYALSENYLYTVEAFQQYLRHLDDDESMLAMIRWNFELPRLMPIVAESLARETGENRAEVGKYVVVVEDRPGLYFGRTDDTQTYYPALVMVKSTPFTASQLDLVRQRAEASNAEVIMLGDSFKSNPYDRLFSSDSESYSEYVSTVMGINPKITTDDSPFYFAREPVPRQMIILLATVLGISAALSVLLFLNARRTGKMKETVGENGNVSSGQTGARDLGFVLFAIFIGLGFMILEITFIQKFLLLLGTPIMALTVILFSILLSSGIGAYLSGRLFGDRPYRAVFVSVPILAGIILAYLFFLQGIIDSNIAMPLQSRAILTFALLSPAGLMMGFQFPSLIRMASTPSLNLKGKAGSDGGGNKTTLLWGINVIASIVGTVLAALMAMIVGFNGNLLIGLGMYLGAGGSAYLALVGSRKYARPSLRLTESG